MNWLDKLKVGDEVIICPYYSAKRLGKVIRTTKTMIIISDGHRYRRRTGVAINPSAYDHGKILECKEKEKEDIIYIQRRKYAKAQLEAMDYAYITTETLEKALAILEGEDAD